MTATATDPRAVLLGRLIAHHHDKVICASTGSRQQLIDYGGLLGGNDPDVGAAFDAELLEVLGANGLDDLTTAQDENDRAEQVTQRLTAAGQHHLHLLWALAGGDDRLVEAEKLAAVGPGK